MGWVSVECGACELAGRAEFREGGFPGRALAAGPGVVRQDPSDGDALLGEPVSCPSQEAAAGGGLLVGQALGAGRAGVVIQGGVQVGAGAGAGVGVRATMGA